jgi:hypothetical protein
MKKKVKHHSKDRFYGRLDVKHLPLLLCLTRGKPKETDVSHVFLGTRNTKGARRPSESTHNFRSG